MRETIHTRFPHAFDNVEFRSLDTEAGLRFEHTESISSSSRASATLLEVSSTLSRASAESVEDALNNFLHALKDISSASKELSGETGVQSSYLYAQAPKHPPK